LPSGTRLGYTGLAAVVSCARPFGLDVRDPCVGIGLQALFEPSDRVGMHLKQLVKVDDAPGTVSQDMDHVRDDGSVSALTQSVLRVLSEIDTRTA
jgi:hypothetical protein